jgi:nucleotide-binding universal stress UspA family protein
MFKHILVPTDGSKLALKGVKAAIKLAKALGARVTGVYVIAPYLPPMYGEAAMGYAPAFSPKEYEKAAEQEARKALEAIEREARAAKVRCTTESVREAQPWRGILKVARAKKCDAIAMASHGRGGVAGLLLGSETSRVLANSKIPVLVTR